MSTTSTLPMLSLVLVVVLLFHTPRSDAQEDSYPAGQFTPPPPQSSSRRPPPPPPLSTNRTTDPAPTARRKSRVPSRVWIPSLYPATDFRSKSTPGNFSLWPENLSYVKFEHYCQDESDHARTLDEFVYKEGLGKLVVRPYFDVGLVDKHFTPYFRHWQFWQGDIKRIHYVVRCEYGDIQRLYAYRLKRNVLASGLGYGVAALTIVQVAVIVFTALLLKRTQSTQHDDQTLSASASTWWSKICHSLHIWISETPWIDCICDWIHLILLVVNGFAMMEGVGHSNFFRWRSMLFYNLAVNYTYLTLFSMISSFLHQCAHFLTRHCFTVPALPRNTVTPAGDGAASGLSEDWRYQRIFGQFGVLVLMGMYLIGVDDGQGHNMDSLAGIVVAVIVVACIWSAGVSAVVAARSVRDMGRCLLPMTRAWKLGAFFDSRAHARRTCVSPIGFKRVYGHTDPWIFT